MNRNQMTQSVMKTAKRIAITICCCLPFLLLFGYFTRKIITNNILQILCFVAIMGVVVLIVEIIARKKEKKKIADEFIKGKKDVFK